jgi:hypothetical protein
MIVQKTIFYTPTALTKNLIYLKIVKKGPKAMIIANPSTTMEPDLFLSFHRETENMTV